MHSSHRRDPIGVRASIWGRNSAVYPLFCASEENFRQNSLSVRDVYISGLPNMRFICVSTMPSLSKLLIDICIVSTSRPSSSGECPIKFRYLFIKWLPGCVIQTTCTDGTPPVVFSAPLFRHMNSNTTASIGDISAIIDAKAGCTNADAFGSIADARSRANRSRSSGSSRHLRAPARTVSSSRVLGFSQFLGLT